MPNSRGFTLIELLVVISIIAIISAIGLVSYTSFIKNSRDARRQADLKFIQSALEEYHADSLYYPTSVTPGSSLSFGSKIYLIKVPNDPVGSPDYLYTPLGDGCPGTPQKCTSYCLTVKLESLSLLPECTPVSPRNYGVTRP